MDCTRYVNNTLATGRDANVCVITVPPTALRMTYVWRVIDSFSRFRFEIVGICICICMYITIFFFKSISPIDSKYKSSDFNRLNVFQRGGYKRILSVRHGFISVVGKKKKTHFVRTWGFLFFFYFLQNWITG